MNGPLDVTILRSKEVPENMIKENLKENTENLISDSPIQSSMGMIENVSLETLKAQNESILNQKFRELAPSRPFYEHHLGRLKWMDKFENKLSNVDGFQATKMKTLSKNPDSARGSFAELARANRIDDAGLRVKAIGKQVETSIGKTDVDIWAINSKGENIWIENKDVQKISMTEDTKLKIDKMAEGNKDVVDDMKGNVIHFDKAVFVNNHSISDDAIEYAKSKGIHIKENMDGWAFKRYISNFL